MVEFKIDNTLLESNVYAEPPVPYGWEDNASRLLSQNDIDTIKEGLKYYSSDRTLTSQDKELANKVGVSVDTVTAIRIGKRHKD